MKIFAYLMMESFFTNCPIFFDRTKHLNSFIVFHVSFAFRTRFALQMLLTKYIRLTRCRMKCQDQ